jgi:gliding motility-associated-like protein
MEIKKSSTFIGVLSLALIFIFSFSKTFAQPCINVFPHVEDFELAPTWTAMTAPTSSVAASSDWAWGTPNHTYVIQSAGSGNKCWSAGNLTGAFYNYWEQSYVVSPCYDFTNLQYPHIKFKLFYDCEYHFDGGNLQTSINGGATWVDVGTCGGTNAAPIPEPNDCNTQNWYNYPGINYLDNPAGFVPSKNGWCGNTQAGGVGWDTASPTTNCVGGNGPGHWITAEHCLAGLAGQPNVIFRFTFGSGFTCNNFDGLAFDSVAVSNGIPNSATFTKVCASPSTINFNATPNACPTNTYAWDFGDAASGGTNTSASQNPSHTFSGPGSYTVSLIASGGACNPPDTIKQVVNIMSAAVTSFSNASCGSLGSATVTVTSGLNPVTYTWSPIGGNTSVGTGLTQGNYTVSVADAGSCPVTATVSITQPSSLSVTAVGSPPSCAPVGSATATAAGGTGPYTYTWTPSGGNAATATGLTGGNYTVTITDNALCSATATVTIANAGGVTATVSSTSVSCNGGTNGSATVTPTSGTGPYSYTWSPAGGNNTIANGLSAGNFTVIVQDANSCSVTATTTISQPTLLNALITSTNVTCNGAADGMANTVANGGTGAYTYTWLPAGGNNATATALAAGNYTVLISDANSCTTSDTVSISQPTVVSVIATGQTICGGQTANLSSNATGGNGAPFTYTWSTGATSANTTATPAISTIYTVVANDSKGCSASDTANVFILPPVEITVMSLDTICPGQVATLTATASGGTGAYSITWIPVNKTGNIISVSPTANTVYTAIVSDACAQSDSAIGQVIVTPIPQINFGANPASGCMPVCAVFAGVATNVPNNNVTTYSWNYGDGSTGTGINSAHCYTVSGNYNVTLYGVTEKGCRDSATVNNLIHVFPIPVADFSASPGLITDIYDNTISFYNQSIGSNITTLKWLFPNGVTSSYPNPVYTFEPEGTYDVTLIATNSNGCADTITKEIIVQPDYTFYAPNAFTPNSDGTNEFFRPTGTAWDLNSYNLWVFDRWGNKIFYTQDTNKGWDGTRYGNELQEDVYVWKVELKDIFGKSHEYNGHISIVK